MHTDEPAREEQKPVETHWFAKLHGLPIAMRGVHKPRTCPTENGSQYFQAGQSKSERQTPGSAMDKMFDGFDRDSGFAVQHGENATKMMAMSVW